MIRCYQDLKLPYISFGADRGEKAAVVLGELVENLDDDVEGFEEEEVVDVGASRLSIENGFKWFEAATTAAVMLGFVNKLAYLATAVGEFNWPCAESHGEALLLLLLLLLLDKNPTDRWWWWCIIIKFLV